MVIFSWDLNSPQVTFLVHQNVTLPVLGLNFQNKTAKFKIKPVLLVFQGQIHWSYKLQAFAPIWCKLFKSFYWAEHALWTIERFTLRTLTPIKLAFIMLKTLISVALEINLQLLFNMILHHDALPIMTAMVLQDHFCFLLLAFTVYECNFAPDGPIFLIFIVCWKEDVYSFLPRYFHSFPMLIYFLHLVIFGQQSTCPKTSGLLERSI